jgi:hypothetical protein
MSDRTTIASTAMTAKLRSKFTNNTRMEDRTHPFDA